MYWYEPLDYWNHITKIHEFWVERMAISKNKDFEFKVIYVGKIIIKKIYKYSCKYFVTKKSTITKLKGLHVLKIYYMLY